MSQTTPMSTKEMQDVLDSARPGDRLCIVFADKPVERIRIQSTLVPFGIVGGRTPTLEMSEMACLNLMAVAESGHWAGFRLYDVTVLEGFDPEGFAYLTLRHGLLESITKL